MGQVSVPCYALFNSPGPSDFQAAFLIIFGKPQEAPSHASIYSLMHSRISLSPKWTICCCTPARVCNLDICIIWLGVSTFEAPNDQSHI